jgi:hypothetical protein
MCNNIYIRIYIYRGQTGGNKYSVEVRVKDCEVIYLNKPINAGKFEFQFDG